MAQRRLKIEEVDARLENLKKTPSPYFGDKNFGEALLEDPLVADVAPELALQDQHYTLPQLEALGMKHIIYDAT